MRLSCCREKCKYRGSRKRGEAEEEKENKAMGNRTQEEGGENRTRAKHNHLPFFLRAWPNTRTRPLTSSFGIVHPLVKHVDPIITKFGWGAVASAFCAMLGAAKRGGYQTLGVDGRANCHFHSGLQGRGRFQGPVARTAGTPAALAQLVCSPGGTPHSTGVVSELDIDSSSPLPMERMQNSRQGAMRIFRLTSPFSPRPDGATC